jgi:hypothetical protein
MKASKKIRYHPPKETIPIRPIHQRTRLSQRPIVIEDAGVDFARDVQRCGPVEVVGRMSQHIRKEAVGVKYGYHEKEKNQSQSQNQSHHRKE